MPKQDFHQSPHNSIEALAQEIAEGFNDEPHLPLYLQICSAHDKTLVWRAYREVLQVPFTGIRKSRRAYFIYLVRKYDTRS